MSDTDVLDAEWLAAPARRSRSRVLLVSTLAVLVVFLAGVEVQKHWGTSPGGAAGGAGPSVTGSGPVSFQGAPGDGGATGTPGSGSSDTTGTAASAPAVIGKLTAVHRHTWRVEDLGGSTHVVHLTARTTLTRPVSEATRPVRTGSRVVVYGTTSGKSVTATAVTLR
jgi:hypothetical protein